MMKRKILWALLFNIIAAVAIVNVLYIEKSPPCLPRDNYIITLMILAAVMIIVGVKALRS